MLATLAFIAGATEKIRLGVSVLVVPYRPAVLTAKQVATIQELSGERMILGIGVGWMKPEFDALGVEFRRRGAITDETLNVIHHLFGADVPGAYNGKLVKFPSFVFLPRPKRPTIWIGGNGPAAMTRAVKFGDGWHPMLPATELKAKVEELHAQARSQPDAPFLRSSCGEDSSSTTPPRRAQKSRPSRKPARPISSWTWGAMPTSNHSGNRSRPSWRKSRARSLCRGAVIRGRPR